MAEKSYGVCILDAKSIALNGYTHPTSMLCFEDYDQCSTYVQGLMVDSPTIDIKNPAMPYTVGIYTIERSDWLMKQFAKQPPVVLETSQINSSPLHFHVFDDAIHQFQSIYGYPSSETWPMPILKNLESELRMRYESLQAFETALDKLPEDRREALVRSPQTVDSLQKIYNPCNQTYSNLIDIVKSELMMLMKENVAVDINQHEQNLFSDFEHEYKRLKDDPANKSLSQAQILCAAFNNSIDSLTLYRAPEIPTEEVQNIKPLVGQALHLAAEQMKDVNNENYERRYISLMTADVPQKDAILFESLCNKYLEEYNQDSPSITPQLNCARAVASAAEFMIQVENSLGDKLQLSELYYKIQNDALQSMNPINIESLYNTDEEQNVGE